MRVDTATIQRALIYCHNHADSQDETELIAWVAEKIGEQVRLEHPRFDVQRFLNERVTS